jgi:hypothetical protein
MAKCSAKLSISVPDELAKAVRRKVGARGLSGFVARAMAHELEREQLGSYLAKMDTDLGPLPTKMLTLARSTWSER